MNVRDLVIVMNFKILKLRKVTSIRFILPRDMLDKYIKLGGRDWLIETLKTTSDPDRLIIHKWSDK